MNILNSDELLKKLNDLKKDNKLDLSSDEDLSLAIMNLIAIEEHLFFTYSKTNKIVYLDMLNEARDIRKTLMSKIVKNKDGEVWCISKHLLSASMRLMEVGTKMLNNGEKEKAEDLFQKSYKLYSMFWGLNLNIIDVQDVLKDDTMDETHIETKKGKIDLFGKMGDIVKHILDCCRE